MFAFCLFTVSIFAFAQGVSVCKDIYFVPIRWPNTELRVPTFLKVISVPQATMP